MFFFCDCISMTNLHHQHRPNRLGLVISTPRLADPSVFFDFLQRKVFIHQSEPSIVEPYHQSPVSSVSSSLRSSFAVVRSIFDRYIPVLNVPVFSTSENGRMERFASDRSWDEFELFWFYSKRERKTKQGAKLRTTTENRSNWIVNQR